jgi:predicted metalloprotease
MDDRQPGGRPSRQADFDGDGLNDRSDPCPADAEDLRWTRESDGCPDGLPELMAIAAPDISGFWERTFQEAREAYRGPSQVASYEDEAATGCGPAVANNAFYCPLDDGIYFHAPFMDAQLRQNGDFAPVFILAHEWGHLVQQRLGILGDASRFSVQIELQADCFAGVYSRDADTRNLLEEGDLDEAVVSLIQAGDPPQTPLTAPTAHGSAQQRVDSFLLGYSNGVEACLI